MKKIKRGILLVLMSLVLCIPSFSANASQLSDYYGGTWWDLNSQRCYMEIAPYGNALFITVSWGSSAFETSEWTMTGFYNSATGKYHYSDCMSKTLTSDAYGNNVAIVNYINGTGTIYISSNGYLYWEDYVEQTGINCYFEKDTMDAYGYLQNTVNQLNPGDVADKVYRSDLNGMEMAIGTYSGNGMHYIEISNAYGGIWRGENVQYSYLNNGGLRLTFSGTNYLTGANDYLTVDWLSVEHIGHPNVSYIFDNVGIGGTYSHFYRLWGN